MRHVGLCFVISTALSLTLALPAFAQLDDAALPVAQAGHQGAMPYTTFSTEQDAAYQKLACKWTSQDGRDGGSRYDFLCVGGNWATVHLMLDKSHKVGDGLARVRLLWREWPAGHPASAESTVAQEFLQYAADRFIAPALAPEVMQAFFGSRERDWQKGDVRLHYELVDNGNHRLHRLEIVGLGNALKLPKAPVPDNRITWPPAHSPEVIQQQPVVPQDGRLPHQSPEIAPKPAPQPAPQVAPKTEPATLQPATPADLAPQPDPESLQKPVAAPTPSATLVPNPGVAGQAKAPSNFDVYNKAQQLTRDVEQKAFGQTLPPKAVPSAQQTTGGLVKAGAEKAAPSVVAVPTPQVSGTGVIGPVRVISPASVTTSGTQVPQAGEGLGSPSTTPAEALTPAQKAAQKAGAAVNAPSTVAPWDQPQPRGANRPLPQLKFVPKAQPLSPANEVIQFEDEKSKL